MYALIYLTGNFSNKISLVWIFKREITIAVDDELAKESAMLSDLLRQLTSVNTCMIRQSSQKRETPDAIEQNILTHCKDRHGFILACETKNLHFLLNPRLHVNDIKLPLPPHSTSALNTNYVYL